MQHYRDLLVWKKGMDLAEAVFRQTESFPKSQLYVLTAQMQRCALSIPSNIAEGRGRNSESEFAYFLNVTRGSACELQTQIELAERLNFMTTENGKLLSARCEEILRMVHGLRTTLKSNAKKAVGSKLSAVG
ncbi:MAG: four helix bundle protein [Rickettsiales bacterium]